MGFPDIGSMLNFLLVKQVRNAFFHSDYILHNGNFNIKHGEGVALENVISRSIALEWLLPRLELGINFALAVIQLTEESAYSYTEEKIVQARLLPNEGTEDMLLMVGKNGGLRGFRSISPEEKNKFNH